jgi:phosphoglycerate dehydrogenase-like enzyme
VHIHHPEMTLWNAPPERIAQWRERFGARGLRVVAAPHDVSFEDGLVDAEILIGHGLTVDLFRRASKLKWIQAPSAGVGHLLFPELVASPVILTNARGVHADPMAEHVIAMMLALVRKIHRARDFQGRGEWSQDELWREEPLLDEIGGRTLGIVGLGAIGKALAWRAHALSMRVIGLRRHPGGNLPPGVDEARGPDELAWLLGQSDFVANCLPSTPATKGLIGREAFRSMKPGAYLFNVGRGTTVDEAAMIVALESGRLAGVGLDVTAEEPLPASSSLYRLPQVLLTFHISGASRRFWDRAAELFEDNVERYLDGRPQRNVVDKQEGY